MVGARKRFGAGIVAAACVACTVYPVSAQVQDMLPTKDAVSARVNPNAFSPYAGRSFPTKVLWGDTHLHTQVSVDAGTMTRLSQENAFRFARGEEVTTTQGLQAKLSRPLDYLVISDHAEMYGLMPQLLGGDPSILATEIGKRWYDALTSGDSDVAFQQRWKLSVRCPVMNRSSRATKGFATHGENTLHSLIGTTNLADLRR